MPSALEMRRVSAGYGETVVIEDIDLTLKPYSSSVYPEQLVATNQAEFGISFPESVTTFRAQGVPIVSVAAVIQHNTSALVSLKRTGT